MNRRRLAWGLLVLALAACLPTGQNQTPGLAPSTAPALEASPTPTHPSIAPTAPPSPSTPTPSRDWPDPFTYVTAAPPSTPIPEAAAPYPFPPDVINFLLIGSDRRSSDAFRTDVLIILSVNPAAGAAALVSIPRDLYVYLPGYTMQRVNAAYYYGESLGYPGGGLGLLKDTILYNLGVRIDRFARIEMGGFSDLIDTLGGIDVDVTCAYSDWRLRSPDLSPDDPAHWRMFTVPAGVVHMGGEYALWYARARAHSSDLDRARRQQELLRAIYRQVISLQLIPRLPALYQDLTSMVSTDVTLADLLGLAPLAPRLDPAQIRSRFIGRDQITPWRVPTSGAQVLVPNREAIRALLEEAFDFETPNPLVPQTFVTIEVVNASSNPDWGRLAAARVNYVGLRAHVGPAEPDPEVTTHLVDYGLGAPEDLQRLQHALGLGADSVVSQADPSSPFPFTLVVGDDYQPCFDPTQQQGD
jgi:LCP family protein required for cell wall assembly